MTPRSAELRDQDPIPVRYSHENDNASPPLARRYFFTPYALRELSGSAPGFSARAVARHCENEPGIATLAGQYSR